MSEHRQSERHRLAFKVVFDDGDSYNVGVVEDISETGLYMHSSTTVDKDAVLRFEPTEEDEDALFALTGRVVRCDSLEARTEATHGMVGIAVEFLSIGEAEKASITEMIRLLESRRRRRSESGIHDPLLGAIVKPS